MRELVEVPLLALRLPAVATSPGRIRAELCAFARANGATGALVDDVALAVTEAAANVVRHAYPDRDDGMIFVAADCEDGTLEVVISDDGAGFGGAEPAEGLGAGLRLIAASAASFGIAARDPSGVEVWMRFLLPRA